MALIATALLFGVLLALAVPSAIEPGLALCVAAGALIWLRGPARTAIAVSCLAVTWATLRVDGALEARLDPALEGRELLLEGRVDDLASSSLGTSIRFGVLHALDLGRPVKVPGRIRLRLGSGTSVPRPGEVLSLTARLHRPHGLSNPGIRDTETSWLVERLGAVGSVTKSQPVRVVEFQRWSLPAIRAAVARRIESALPGKPMAGVVVALANGDGGGIPETQWRLFRRTGTVHLVTVSGLHISLVAGLVAGMGTLVWRRFPKASLVVPARIGGAALGLVAGTAYTALSGFCVPAQRALIMVVVVFLARMARTTLGFVDALGWALVVVLVVDPMAALQSGFWLSFLAVAAIAGFSSGGWEARKGLSGQVSTVERLLAHGRIQWWVALVLAPGCALLFGEIPLIGPIANLVAIPVFDLWAVPLSLAGVVIGSLWPAAGAPLLRIAESSLELLWPLLNLLDHSVAAVWATGTPGPAQMLAAIIGLFWLLAPRGFPVRGLGVLWLLPAFAWPIHRPANGDATLTLLDVGQGLSAIVETKRHTLVFDTGPPFGADSDAASRVIVPYLRARRTTRPDLVILSHDDSDHTGGARTLLDAVDAAEVLGNTAWPPNRQPCVAGRHWSWDGVDFRVLYPKSLVKGNDNANSCVLRIQAHHDIAIITSDLEAPGEDALVAGAEKDLLRAHVLIAPHHGSHTSSTEGFLRAVTPDWILIPVGHRNRYGHPHADVLDRYDAIGARVETTAEAGAIRVGLGASLTVDTQREGSHRAWWARP